jgi:hypothetical protein
MAYTYSKIATYTVGSGGIGSIDFLNIPQNYTDLILKYSIRSAIAGYSADDLGVRFNSDSVVGSYGWRRLTGNGSSVGSSNSTSYDSGLASQVPASTATANTFGNSEMYIPNYTGSYYKSVSIDSVGENNATGADANLVADIWNKSNPITSIKIFSVNGANLTQYSTAHLYGIKAEV